ncbi:hypothetical protein [Pleurocapsa sp. PCC 7319]|uniref:hypothetical protein n=1 Tax=Pleurocapsa sp. PCC 7319 TaxID=118161 RepID=UPI00034C16DA|nr:hypothetical protein [Pleurocapsa sp. PCC 7319]
MKGFLAKVIQFDAVKDIDLQSLKDDELYVEDYFTWIQSDEYAEHHTDTDDYEGKELDKKVRASVIGRLASQYRSRKNRFRNNHLWYLYFDRYAFESPESVKDRVRVSEPLEVCLGILELDNVLLYEAATIGTFIPEFEEVDTLDILKRYQTQIVKQCYKTGKFETPLWKVECNINSDRSL